MEFSDKRNFRIWRYDVNHRQLHIRSVGYGDDPANAEINLHFRGVVRVDTDVEFITDQISELDSAPHAHRRQFVSNLGKERYFEFKLNGDVVAQVVALFFDEGKGFLTE